MQRMKSGLSQPEVASCSIVWGYGDSYPPQMVSDCGGGYPLASLAGQRELAVTPAAPSTAVQSNRVSPLSRPLAQNCLQNHVKS